MTMMIGTTIVAAVTIGLTVITTTEQFAARPGI
jgi:hypothetical protein